MEKEKIFYVVIHKWNLTYFKRCTYIETNIWGSEGSRGKASEEQKAE